jgi:hypothetical protein
VLLLLGIGAVVATVMFVGNKFNELKEDMANPIVRTEKVKKTLGATELPEGYQAVMALGVPAIMDIAVLSTRAPEDHSRNAKEDERLFMYMFVKASSTNDVEELSAYLEGRSDDVSVLARHNIHIRAEEITGRGVIPLEGRRVLYIGQRGELSTGQLEKRGSGLNSISLIECPGQTLLRIGIWSAPDPSPGTPIEQLDVKGTPVDPEAIKDFMSHLNPCQVK